MVGDGMQCPPSPLLFDPSVALRDVTEAPIDILALEEPAQPGLPPQPTPVDRGTVSAYVFSPGAAALAELPAQVQPGSPGGGLPAAALGVPQPSGSWRTALPGGERSPTPPRRTARTGVGLCRLVELGPMVWAVQGRSPAPRRGWLGAARHCPWAGWRGSRLGRWVGCLTPGGSPFARGWGFLGQLLSEQSAFPSSSSL